jgi:hypothetical protein
MRDRCEWGVCELVAPTIDAGCITRLGLLWYPAGEWGADVTVADEQPGRKPSLCVQIGIVGYAPTVRQRYSGDREWIWYAPNYLR